MSQPARLSINPLSAALIFELGRQVQTLTGTRQSNPNGSQVYLTAPVENTINGSIPIPSNFTPGQYLAGIAILEPTTQKPGVYFAVRNFFKQSQTQPLCRIGIGADATDNTLTGPFDSLADSNDTRYYTTNQSPKLHADDERGQWLDHVESTWWDLQRGHGGRGDGDAKQRVHV